MTGSMTVRPMRVLSFVEMLKSALAMRDNTLTDAAAAIGISPQYLHDLKAGRRLPSVDVTEKICDWLGRGPQGRTEWHIAAARAHGWKI